MGWILDVPIRLLRLQITCGAKPCIMYITSTYGVSAEQKIKKLSETPVTVHNIAKLCVIDGKNREITKKLVQPVPPPPLLDQWEFQWENDLKK